VVTDGLGGQFCPQSWCPWVHDGSSPGASRRGSCVVVSPRQARHPAWLRADSFPFGRDVSRQRTVNGCTASAGRPCRAAMCVRGPDICRRRQLVAESTK
jgi:hypothetical protein